MKMILANMPTHISDLVSSSLLASGFRVTKFASTAGLLSAGTTTLMVAAESSRIDQALGLIRTQVEPLDAPSDSPARVTIYVLNLKDFTRL